MGTRLIFLTSVLGFVAAAGCAHTIEGTKVADTPDGRAIVGILTDVRESLEARDADGILRHVSPDYFDTCGTADPSDDFGYAELKAHILSESLEAAKEVHVAFEIQDIVVEGDKAHADIRYSSRARLGMPAGDKWESNRDFDRVRFERADGKWMITGGL